MGNYLYFADGNGADATEEACVVKASDLTGVSLSSAGTTTIAYFVKNIEGLDFLKNKTEITFTHDDTKATTGHRSRQIARALAIAANSPPKKGMITIVDLDNDEFFGDLDFVTGLGIVQDNIY